jgi:aminopeptidase N
MNRYSTMLLMATLMATSAHAQLDTAAAARHGCHFHRNQEHRFRGPITPEQALMIEETIARSDTFDIVHYDIAIDVTDYSGQTIRAATTVTFRALLENLTAIRFDLYQLSVDSVLYNGNQLAYDHDGQYLQIYFAGALETGVDHEVEVHYGGSPHRDDQWGGFYFEQDYIYNLGIGITTIPPNFGKVWYPCFDSFVEKATYTYHVKSAGTFRAHCQGEFLGETPLEGDTVIRSYALYQPIPS